MNRRELVLAAAAAPLAWRAVLARAGGTPLALVTADAQSHVAAVGMGTGRVVRRVRTLAGPRSIESVGGTAVVAHTAGGAISLLDAATLRIKRVLVDVVEPRYTVGHPDGRYAFVTDSGRGEVVVLDVVRMRIVDRLAVGGPARHLAIDARGRALWVALGTKAERVAVLDVSRPGRPRLLREFRPPFLAHDVGFAPGNRVVWVTSGDRGTIGLYNARSRRILRRLAADAPPQHVTFHGDRAYVTSGDDGLLRVHDAHDGRLLRTTRVPVGSYNVQHGWGRILTPSLSGGTLCVLNTGGGIVERVQVASSSHDACFVMSA